ncbi:MAG TPA: PH domain-containing protein [Mycobacteriales bacterium]|jgi:Protein of unknown function (DUF2581).
MLCHVEQVEQPERQWAPRPVETGVAAALGLGMSVGSLAVADLTGRFLVLVAGLGLLALAAGDLLARPRLRADRAGVSTRTLTGRIDLPWSRVEGVRVDQRRGFAIRSVLLEIDAGETIILLGRHALGTDPRDVADVLTELRTSAGDGL